MVRLLPHSHAIHAQIESALRIMPRAGNANFIQQMRIFAVQTCLPPALSSAATFNPV
jgi:hypothetical protein